MKLLLSAFLFTGLTTSCSLLQSSPVIGPLVNTVTDTGVLTLTPDSVTFVNANPEPALNATLYLEGPGVVVDTSACTPVVISSRDVSVNAYACKIGTIAGEGQYLLKPSKGALNYTSITYYRPDSTKVPVFKSKRLR